MTRAQIAVLLLYIETKTSVHTDPLIAAELARLIALTPQQRRAEMLTSGFYPQARDAAKARADGAKEAYDAIVAEGV